MWMSEKLKGVRVPEGIPPLVGLGRMEDAFEKGLSVTESVECLKRFHWAFRQLHRVWLAKLTAEPVYELKMAYSYHAWLAAEIAQTLRDRVGEMREPPLGLDRLPHGAWEVLFDEVMASPDTEHLLVAVYEVLVPVLKDGLERLHEETHLLADQPTRRLCQHALLDWRPVAEYGEQLLKAFSGVEAEGVREWRDYLLGLLGASGGIDGASEEQSFPMERRYSLNPPSYNSRPARDERFPDPYNMGVNAEVFLYDETMPAAPKVLMMFYKRLREIDVPEMMASILTETEGKPWAYYRDMTRQLWDEARHAMMGEVGFESLGIEWPARVMVNFTWSSALNEQLDPKERHAVLYFIEQGLMPKTGKRHEWEVALMAENELAATFQDFDWADEVLHARVGRDWYVSDMPSMREAIDYGDACWSKVLLNWESWRKEGLTEHRNWWPELVEEWCRKTGQEVDPRVVAFDVSYEKTRADLKNLAE